MSTRAVRWGIAGSLCALAIIGGCSPAGDFGETIKSTTETSIADILNHPAAYAGKTLVVQGQIAKVEPGGKEFMLDNGRGRYLEVTCGTTFKIPAAAKYRLATCEGTLAVDGDGKPVLKATGVRIK